MSDFFEKVYLVASKIPYGRVTSYGAIARFLGSGKSSRMVGYAMNNASEKEEVPAHRVVNRNGLLTGKHHFGGNTIMEDLLRSERIEVENDKVQDFEKLFWDPGDHLNRDEFLIDK